MNKETFTGKKFVESFSFSTANKEDLRNGVKEVVIDGRKHLRLGRYQAVTFIGYKYKCENGKTLLVVGLSKQNPIDLKENAAIAEEYAAQRVIEDPCIMMEVHPHFSNGDFVTLMYTYLKNVDVEFVKTRAERQIALKNAAAEEYRIQQKTMHSSLAKVNITKKLHN